MNMDEKGKVGTKKTERKARLAKVYKLAASAGKSYKVFRNMPGGYAGGSFSVKKHGNSSW